MTLDVNPLVNGVRVLAPDFTRVYGRPDVLSGVQVKTSIGESEVNQLTFTFQRRLPRATVQAHYTLASAYAYGGSWAARGGSALPQDSFNPLADGEWGPTGRTSGTDSSRRASSSCLYGVQLSPVFQVASARPYNLTAGSDLNADGTNNDRWVDPGDGPAGFDQCGTGRRDGRARSAGDGSFRSAATAGSPCLPKSSTRSTTSTSAEATRATAAACCSGSLPGDSSPEYRVSSTTAAGRAIPILDGELMRRRGRSPRPPRRVEMAILRKTAQARRSQEVGHMRKKVLSLGLLVGSGVLRRLQRATGRAEWRRRPDRRGRHRRNGDRRQGAGGGCLGDRGDTDLPTKMHQDVVTDDRGRYVIPDLPKANYTSACAATDWSTERGLNGAPERSAEPDRCHRTRRPSPPRRTSRRTTGTRCSTSRPRASSPAPVSRATVSPKPCAARPSGSTT